MHLTFAARGVIAPSFSNVLLGVSILMFGKPFERRLNWLRLIKKAAADDAPKALHRSPSRVVVSSVVADQVSKNRNRDNTFLRFISVAARD